MQNERGGNAEKVGNAGGEERSEVDCGRHEGAVVVWELDLRLREFQPEDSLSDPVDLQLRRFEAASDSSELLRVLILSSQLVLSINMKAKAKAYYDKESANKKRIGK